MRWTEQPIFFVDFEGSLGSGVLEYGVATLLGGRVTETRTRLCAATGRVRPEDTAVHGLRAEAIAAQPPLAADWEYFAGLRERGPLAASFAPLACRLLKLRTACGGRGREGWGGREGAKLINPQ